MLKAATLLLVGALAASHAQTTNPFVSATLVSNNVRQEPFKYESDTKTSVSDNQSVTVSGTFYLEHVVTGSVNNDPSWSFPFNQGLQDHGYGNEVQVPFSASGIVPTTGQSYWARLWTTAYEGSETWDCYYQGLTKPSRVSRSTIWYEQGTNTVQLVVN